jgi:hypothetical protein
VRRSLALLLALVVGVAVGFVVASSREVHTPRPSAPYAEFTHDFTVRRGQAPAVYYRPYSVIHDGRRVLTSDGPHDPAAVTLFHFDGGRLQVACTEVPAPPIDPR